MRLCVLSRNLRKGDKMLTEVDTRKIHGTEWEVTLWMDGERYSVTVHGLPITTTESRSEALDAYRHPFANPATPDVFSEQDEQHSSKVLA